MDMDILLQINGITRVGQLGVLVDHPLEGQVAVAGAQIMIAHGSTLAIRTNQELPAVHRVREPYVLERHHVLDQPEVLQGLAVQVVRRLVLLLHHKGHFHLGEKKVNN